MTLDRHIKCSVIIVNYNGRRYLEPCLRALLPQTGPDCEVLLVDNASSDGSPELVAQAFPQVRLIRAPSNLGFAGGNNLGIGEARGEYLVLLNNDTEVEPGWLSSLIAAAEADGSAGAVGSKLLFYGKFVPVSFSCAPFIPSHRGGPRDERTLGFSLGTDAGFRGTWYRKTFFESGFYHEEADPSGVAYRWSQGVARVLLPCGAEEAVSTLVLRAACGAGEAGKELAVQVGGATVAVLQLTPEFREYQVSIDSSLLAGARVDVINNAGSFLLPGTRAGDLGFGEMDLGQFDAPQTRDNLCGGSVLLRRSMLDQVGHFDQRLFMYYEDTDLFWRARKRGWKLLYEPRSVVRHVHAGSSQEWSPFFCFHVFRNRFLITLKNGSWRDIAYNAAVLIHPLVGHLGRALRALVLGGRLDAAALSGARLQLRIIGGVFRQLIPFLAIRIGASR